MASPGQFSWDDSLRLAVTSLRSARLVLCALALVACAEPTGVSRPGRAVLVALGAPETHLLGAPLKVTIKYELGACDRFISVQGRVVGTILEVEVQKAFELPPGVDGCIDIGPTVHQTSYSFATPPVGTVTVRGLQPELRRPIERHVVVTFK